NRARRRAAAARPGRRRAGRARPPARAVPAAATIHGVGRSWHPPGQSRATTLGAIMSSDKNAPAGAYRAPPPHALADCPLHAAFRAVGGKWKLTILYWMAREPNHFSGLQRRVAPISHKV